MQFIVAYILLCNLSRKFFSYPKDIKVTRPREAITKCSFKWILVIYKTLFKPVILVQDRNQHSLAVNLRCAIRPISKSNIHNLLHCSDLSASYKTFTGCYFDYTDQINTLSSQEICFSNFVRNISYNQIVIYYNRKIVTLIQAIRVSLL